MANSSPASLKDVATDVPLPPVEPDIGAMIAARAARDPARTAVRFRDPAGKWTDLSWGELDYRRLRIAAGLRSLGVGPGDRVGFVSHNRAEMLVAELGVVTLGAIAVPVFPEYGGQTLSHFLRDNGARAGVFGTPAQQNPGAPLPSTERNVLLHGHPLPPPRAPP